MFPQVERLDTAVGTVSTGVGSLSGVSHRVGLQGSGLSESFPTVGAGQLGLGMDLHVFLEIVLGGSFVLAVTAVEVLVLGVFEQHVLIMVTFHREAFPTFFTNKLKKKKNISLNNSKYSTNPHLLLFVVHNDVLLHVLLDFEGLLAMLAAELLVAVYL